MARGVYILALRDNSYYNWAVNLAASVKFHSPELFVTLLHDGNFNSIPINEQFVFDANIKIDETAYNVNNEFQPGHCKLSLFDYFSHDENIYLDSDSIAIAPLNQLFEACKNNHVGLQIVKKYNYQDSNWDCIWMQWDELKQA
jgi:lipopolysaccharide biosynthesis glycosyltransferase